MSDSPEASIAVSPMNDAPPTRYETEGKDYSDDYGKDPTADEESSPLPNSSERRLWHKHFEYAMEELRKLDERWRKRFNSSNHGSQWKSDTANSTSIIPTAATTGNSAAAAAIATAMMTIVTWYEMKLQRQLTAPPVVYGQIIPYEGDSDSSSSKKMMNHGSDPTANTTVTAAIHPTFHPFSYITISDVYQHMIQSNQYRNIIQRPIQPSLFVGTRAYVSSTMAYLIQHSQYDRLPVLNAIRQAFVSKTKTKLNPRHYHYHYDSKHKTVQFREIIKMPTDGATITIDWKFPYDHTSDDKNSSNSNYSNNKTIEEWIHEILYGPISRPVVLILHGINNHTNFGYIQSMMNICCAKGNGYIAAGMNFRGCASAIPSSLLSDAAIDTPPPLLLFDSTTPRTYNGAYTGDLRSAVQKLSVRLSMPSPQRTLLTSSSSSSSESESESESSAASSNNTPSDDRSKQVVYQPLFLVGNSLGANLLTKYLGEEGRCGTLHPCIAGGVTMGNPMHIDSRNASPIISPLIALGAKRGLYNIYPTMKAMVRSSSHFRQCMTNGWRALTLADYDNAMAPIFCRNEPSYPFQYQIGYHNQTGKDAAADYWVDASSYRQLPHISVPFLQLIARDDFLTYRSFRDHMFYNIINPYVMVMETTCGGHLGWHEAVVDTKYKSDDKIGPRSWAHSLLGTSWADVAMIDFIQAILELHKERQIGCHSNDQRVRRNDFNSSNDENCTRTTVHKDDLAAANVNQQRSRL